MRRDNNQYHDQAKMKEYIKLLGIVAIVLSLGWLIVSLSIFRFRHPWATDTERFLYIGDALILRKVPYNEMRPRE